MELRRLWPVALATLALAFPASPAGAALRLPLDHAGRWVTDASGRVTVLHGVNLVYKRPPYAPDAAGFSDADAAFLASEGFETVRLGLVYKAVEPAPGIYDDAYLARVARTVEVLARHGLASLLDFHQDLYNERFQGEGWPDWAVIDDGLPAQPRRGFPLNYVVMPALQRAFDHFYANDRPAGQTVGLTDRYAAAWGHVAAFFREQPAVLGYDLLNEPWPGSTWQQCANPQGCPAQDPALDRLYAKVVPAIRQADPRHLIFYEPFVLFNYGADTTLAKLGDAHAAMSFHDYCLTADFGASGAGCGNFDGLVFSHADARAARTGDAVMLTEFGATRDAVTLNRVTALADTHLVGWQYWHLCGCDDPTTSGPGDAQALIYDLRRPPTEDNVDAAKLRILARPHPRAVAGTPIASSWNPGRFTLAWTVRRADGRGDFAPGAVTEIPVPRRTFPGGYAVALQGGRVRSAPGAAVLEVSACPGAGTVALVVTAVGADQQSCAAPTDRKVRLRVRVSPRRVRAGARQLLNVQVRVGRRAVRGAIVRVGRARTLTGRRGIARLRVRFVHPGRRTVYARARGYEAGRAVVRVVRAGA